MLYFEGACNILHMIVFIYVIYVVIELGLWTVKWDIAAEFIERTTYLEYAKI